MNPEDAQRNDSRVATSTCTTTASCHAPVKLLRLLFCLLLPITLWQPQVSRADYVVRITEPHSKLDQRHLYNNALLTAVLEKSSAEFGSYSLSYTLPATQRDRALTELISGKRINVHIVPTQKEWEEKVIPIRIPVAKGLLGYRLFLIKRENAAKFRDLKSVQQLKSMKAGLRQQWATTNAMKKLGFNVVTGISYEGLFNMLSYERFDYFPRGLNEIYAEFEKRKESLPNIMIEPSKALYIPQPTYIFVSPKYPGLAKRIETGLKALLRDGSLDRLFREYHGPSIERANLAGRTIFTQPNPLLSPQTPFDQKSLWFDPLAGQ